MGPSSILKVGMYMGGGTGFTTMSSNLINEMFESLLSESAVYGMVLQKCQNMAKDYH